MTEAERDQSRGNYWSALLLFAKTHPGERVPTWTRQQAAAWLTMTRERAELNASTHNPTSTATTPRL